MTAILDYIKLRGDVHFMLYDEWGNLKLERNDHNLVVTAGLNHVTSRLIGVGENVMGWMEVGTSNTGALSSDTALGTAVAASRTALTSITQQTTTLTNDTVQFLCTFAAGVGTGALVEAGVFNASSGVKMFCRTVFSVINKAAGDSLTVTWKVKFA